MKATIEFNLPEEQSEYEEFQQGPRAYSALWSLAEQLRQRTKYGTDEVPTWERFRELLYEACDEYRVKHD